MGGGAEEGGVRGEVRWGRGDGFERWGWRYKDWLHVHGVGRGGGGWGEKGGVRGK